MLLTMDVSTPTLAMEMLAKIPLVLAVNASSSPKAAPSMLKEELIAGLSPVTPLLVAANLPNNDLMPKPLVPSCFCLLLPKPELFLLE